VSSHRATIEWALGDGSFTYEAYPRDHVWPFEGGERVAAAAAPGYLGSADRVDPEEAFVASLSSCHMLTFLALATKNRLTVRSYRDEAVGVLEKDDRGRLAVTRVTLSPAIEWGGDAPEQATVDRLHHQAHEHCFIANSVLTEVVVGGAGP